MAHTLHGKGHGCIGYQLNYESVCTSQRQEESGHIKTEAQRVPQNWLAEEAKVFTSMNLQFYIPQE